MAVGFSWLEVEEYGVPLNQLHVGDWFAVVLSSENGLYQETVTGRVEYKCLGSTEVRLDNFERGKAIWWCQDCKVIPLPKPVREPRRVSLNPDNYEDNEENGETE